MAPCRVVDHRRHVVGDHEAGEADLVQRPHHRERVDVALVYEALVEARHLALHVAEVDVDDPVPAAEVAHRVQHAARTHLRPAAHAEVQAVIGAVERVDGALEAIEVAEDARHAAERRHRRVVRVERQGDAGLLGDRQHGAQVVFVVGPHLGLVELAAVSEGSVPVLGQVEPGGQRAASQPRELGGAPHPVRHPVVPQDRDAGAPHVADGRLHVLDLLVAAGQAQHRLVVERYRHVLQAHQPQLGGIGPLPQRRQVGQLPPFAAGQIGRVHQEVVGAELLDEGELLVGELPELPQPDSHLVCRSHVVLLSRSRRRQPAGL